MELTVTQKYHGMMLRAFLQKELKLSGKLIRHIKFLPDGITVNGTRVSVRYVLSRGDRLYLATEDREATPILPVDLPLSVLYEDDDIVVPCKPADMPTHPSHGHREDTVANALAYRYRSCKIPFVFRPVNRLDRNTSGLLLIARSRRAADMLARAMQAGEIRKRYLAILDGEMTEKEGIIDACLHRTAESIILREVCSPDTPDADAAQTAYRVLAVGEGHTLVEARPLTGRTHQLRVHFAHIGYPITGDEFYGTPSFDIPRHALHARALAFPHPQDGRRMELTAPLTPDFDALLHRYFKTLSERSLP